MFKSKHEQHQLYKQLNEKVLTYGLNIKFEIYSDIRETTTYLCVQ